MTNILYNKALELIRDQRATVQDQQQQQTLTLDTESDGCFTSSLHVYHTFEKKDNRPTTMYLNA